MSLLSQASLVMIPSGYKEDVVYSVKPTDGSGDLTFTRASDGTRVNSQGLVERVPWNLLQQSNQFDTTWSRVNSTLTSGQTGYDGSSNAWLLEKTDYNGRIHQGFSQGGLQTYSIYAKKGLSDYLRLYVDGAVPNVYFNLTNGSIYIGSNYIDASTTDVGNGWYRCQVTFDGSSTLVRIYPAEAGSTTISQSGSIYIQDAQVVEGSTAKPYFPTTDRLNVPRLDYSNGCPSLLLEPQRTNVVLYSEQFDDAAWLKGNISVTANNATSPDGTQNAEKVTNTDILNVWMYQLSQTSATTWSHTVYAKKGTNKYLGISLCSQTTPSTSRYQPVFNLDDGTLQTINQSGSNETNTSYSINSVGNGWYKITASFTFAAGSDYCYVVYQSSNNTSYSPNSGALDWQTATIGDYYIWGAQLEAGSYPTSYIPTTSASVTRVADAAYKTGISSLIGQTAGSFYLEYTPNDVSVSTAQDYIPFAISDGTGSNSIFFNDYNGNLLLIVQTGGVIQTTISYGDLVAGQTFKIAGAYNTNDVALYINGTQIGTDTSATIPATSKLSLNGFTSAVHIGSVNINQAALFKTRLTNAELAALTTL